MGRPDNQIIDAVTIDIPSTRDIVATQVAGRHPVDTETVGSVEDGEIEARGEPRGRPENHIARTGTDAWRSDDQVVDTIAVDVPRARY